MKNFLTNRVPQITLIFWIIKILSTTVGETGADFLAETLGLGLTITSYITGGLLIIALAVQLKLKKYVPVSYWTVVVLISIFGTLVTDRLVDDFGVSLITTSIVFTIAMIIGFVLWYKSENTLSIHTINSTKREVFYWIIIFLTFALGTSTGDLISEEFAVGYLLSLILFGVVIATVTICYYRFKLNSTLAFWIAFIMTRPLGASIGDLLTQPRNEGGLALSVTVVNTFFLLIILGLVGYLNVKYKKNKFMGST